MLLVPKLFCCVFCFGLSCLEASSCEAPPSSFGFCFCCASCCCCMFWVTSILLCSPLVGLACAPSCRSSLSMQACFPTCLGYCIGLSSYKLSRSLTRCPMQSFILSTSALSWVKCGFPKSFCSSNLASSQAVRNRLERSGGEQLLPKACLSCPKFCPKVCCPRFECKLGCLAGSSPNEDAQPWPQLTSMSKPEVGCWRLPAGPSSFDLLWLVILRCYLDACTRCSHKLQKRKLCYHAKGRSFLSHGSCRQA